MILPQHHQAVIDGQLAEIERLKDAGKVAAERLSAVLAWLRGNANAEKEPKARAAFIEAHNAALKIAEGRNEVKADD